jgi:hypothetical protein
MVLDASVLFKDVMLVVFSPELLLMTRPFSLAGGDEVRIRIDR